ncbi:hypothetical protein BDK51DRAFT_49387, partial [Blyttiomyces helicus]
CWRSPSPIFDVAWRDAARVEEGTIPPSEIDSSPPLPPPPPLEGSFRLVRAFESAYEVGRDHDVHPILPSGGLETDGLLADGAGEPALWCVSEEPDSGLEGMYRLTPSFRNTFSHALPPPPIVFTTNSSSEEPQDAFPGSDCADAVRAIWDAADNVDVVVGRVECRARRAVLLAEVAVARQLLTYDPANRDRAIALAKDAELVAASMLRELPGGKDPTLAASLSASSLASSTVLPSSSPPTPGNYHPRSFSASPPPLSSTSSSPRRLDLECILADAMLFRGSVQITAGKEIKGAFNLRRAFKLYTRIAPDAAHLPHTSPRVRAHIADCAVFGVGAFMLAAAVVSWNREIPSSTLTVLRTMGVTPDRDGGVARLRAVFNRGGLRAPLAALLLMHDASEGIVRGGDWRESGTGGGDLDDARARAACEVADDPLSPSYLDSPPSNHSKSPLHALATSRLHRHLGHPSRSLSTLASFSAPPAPLAFELGIAFALVGDWARAREWFRGAWVGGEGIWAGSLWAACGVMVGGGAWEVEISEVATGKPLPPPLDHLLPLPTADPPAYLPLTLLDHLAALAPLTRDSSNIPFLREHLELARREPRPNVALAERIGSWIGVLES